MPVPAVRRAGSGRDAHRPYYVVPVADGDTITLLDAGKEQPRSAWVESTHRREGSLSETVPVSTWRDSRSTKRRKQTVTRSTATGGWFVGRRTADAVPKWFHSSEVNDCRKSISGAGRYAGDRILSSLGTPASFADIEQQLPTAGKKSEYRGQQL